MFGLLGPNGAGKTTTILMLLGLTEPTGGSALVLGFDPLRDPLQVKRHVGYLPDNVGFYEAMTGRENLRYTARLNGIPDEESDGTITELLARVGLPRRARTRSRPTPGACASGSGWRTCWSRTPRSSSSTSRRRPSTRSAWWRCSTWCAAWPVTRVSRCCCPATCSTRCSRCATGSPSSWPGDVVAMGTVAEIAASQQRGAQVTLDIGADGDVAAVGAVISAVPGVVAADGHRSPGSTAVDRERAARRRARRSCRHSWRRVIRPWLVRDRGMELDEIYQRYFAATPAAAEEAAA